MSIVVNTSRAVLGLIVLALSASASAQAGHVMRFNTNGTVDATLGSSNGLILSVPGATSSVINETIIVSDKIYIVGSAVIAGVSCFMVGRRNANGTPDTTFSGDGFAFVNQGSVGEARGVAFFKGKLVAAGWRTLASGDTALVVARFNSTDGTPDSGFGTSGVAQVSYAGFHAIPENVAITPETQSVVVGGSRYNFLLSESDFMVTRFNTNGTLYNAFGTNGTRIIEFTETGYVQAYDMDIRMGKTDASGDILIGGTAVDPDGRERCAVAVLTIAGANQNTFDSDGRKVFASGLGNHDRCQTVEYGVSSRIMIAGATWFNGDVDIRFLVGSLTYTGAWSTNFGGDGRRDFQFPELDGENIKDIFTPATGFSNFVVVGSGFVEGGFDEVLAIAHFDWQGNLTSFGDSGQLIFDMPDYSINVGNAAAIESDGQVVTVGFVD